MADRVRSHDWSATPLGPLDAWPERLRVAVEIVLGSGQPMYLVWGPQLTSIFNDAYVPLLGAKADGALGMPMRELWSDAWDQIEPLLDKALAGEGTWMEDMPIVLQRHGFEETAYFTFSYSALWGESGRPEGMLNTVVETTSRVRAERENERLLSDMRNQEAQLQLAMKSLTLGYWELDPRSRRIKWSENSLRMFGFAGPTEVDLELPIARIHPEDRESVVAALAAALDPGSDGSYATHYRVLWPDGSLHWLNAVGQVQFRDEGGTRQPTRFAGVLWDVTEQQRLIEQLRETDRRKDEFIAILSHELRGPLAPLRNALWMLQRSAGLTVQDREMLAIAERQRRQLAYLVGDLLEIGRVTSGKIELRPEPMAVAAAVRSAVESVRPSIDQRDQKVMIDLPTEALSIVADPARVAQILENLLANASKYTRPRGNIWVTAEASGDDAEIRVIDDGIGIDPAKSATLFQPFSQIDASFDRAQGGLGIGLALVKRLVELHGGSVAVRSDGIGKGSTFIVRLPGRPPAGASG
jgi:PAS domain S-box-containing protein